MKVTKKVYDDLKKASRPDVLKFAKANDIELTSETARDLRRELLAQLEALPEKDVTKVSVNRAGGTIIFFVSKGVEEIEATINGKEFSAQANGGLVIIDYGRPLKDYPSIVYKSK